LFCHPIGDGPRAVFQGDRVFIEDAPGRVMAERRNPRAHGSRTSGKCCRPTRAPTSTRVTIRAWQFRVVSNLAIDHLRRHSTWKELVLVDARERAAADSEFVTESQQMRGSPELAAIAREHLAVCFACMLHNVPPQQAAALLLREVYGFSTAETAESLEATVVQVKNWIQQARRTMEERHAHSCALVTKQGVVISAWNSTVSSTGGVAILSTAQSA
jgi:RNA polymerase sigma factor (sigma-70 family)